MKDTFSYYHPAVNFLYFSAVIIFSMFFMHPIFLFISLICGITYYIYLNREKNIKSHFFYMLLAFFLFALINPVFNHEGATILVYINDNPITLESILYGIAAATMFISVIIWFSCYNEIMSSDKFIYLFGRIIPSLSLILSMVLRLVPKLKSQIHIISNAQKCIGRDVSNGNLFQKLKNGIKIISILTSWTLENAIETSDSMKSRGYGLKGRTSFSNYVLNKRDIFSSIIMIFLILLLLFGALIGENNIVYFPMVVIKQVGTLSVIMYICYGTLCLLPVIINILEDIKWIHLKSKI